MKNLSILFAVTAALLFSFPENILAIDATFTVSVVPPIQVTEGGKSLIFALRRTGNLSGVTVRYKMTGTAVSGQDYAAPSGSAAFFQGTEVVNVAITTTNDTVPESAETVTLNILPPIFAGDYQVGSPGSATATILDDEPVLTLTGVGQPFEQAGSISVNPIGFKISRTGPTTNALRVRIQIAGTATNGTDYNLVSTAVQIPVNSSEFLLPIVTKDDSLKDPDETIQISIVADNQSYTLGPQTSATLTILDNDPPKISLSVSDAEAAESNLSTAIVKVERTGDAQNAVTVNYTVNPANSLIAGTAATSGVDFVALSGSIVVPRNQTFANIVITPLDDSIVEGTEKVLIRLSPSTVYDLAGTTNQTISLLDNDFPAVSVLSTDGIASENGLDPGSFTFSRTGPTNSSLSIRFNIATAGTNQATRNTDYSLPIRIVGDIVTIPSGQNSVVVTVTPIDDSQTEPQEQVNISIVPDPAYVLGKTQIATIFISDND